MSWESLFMLSRINNRRSTFPWAGWFPTQKIYCRSSYLLHSRNWGYGCSVKKRAGSVFVDLTAANATLCSTATSPAKVFAHGQHICNCNFTLTIATGPPKKITTLNKQLILGIGFGYSAFQHSQIIPYNSYYHCKEIFIRKGELLDKCYH